MEPTDTQDASELLDERALSKLVWRSRRGLLENDLLIEKFFRAHEGTLTVRQAQGMNDLMDLSDNDLLDLLLRRKEPGELSEENAQASASTAPALEVLALLRPAAPATGPSSTGTVSVQSPLDTKERSNP